MRRLKTAVLAWAPDVRVFGPPDGPRQVPLWEHTGPPFTCPGCGASWRGLGRECWYCRNGRGGQS